ncbi:MAG TPA: SLC13 family permease [Tepidisphaeraceae bacterium]|nr:SLC13 family permease [Tepidisphaeraceae bacterium]
MELSEPQQRVIMWAIFGVTYAGIAMGRFPKLVLDRTGIALLGSIAMLLVHGVTIQEASAHIDFPTMLLLFGLMIFSAQLRVAGFYVWTGRFLTRLTDRPKVLLAGLIVTSAVLSALLANDIVCLAFTPLLCQAILAAKRNPVPYLLALATSSNLGSAATIIGNPQNMYIGTVAKLSFGHFSLVMLPVVVVGLVLCWGMTVLLFRRSLAAEGTNGSRIAEAARHEGETLVPSSLPLQTQSPERDGYLIGKTLIILTGLVVFFLYQTGPAASEWRAIGALVGAGLLLCSHRAKAAKLYQLVDWNLLLLFLGLFVVNGAMKEHRLMDEAFGAVAGRGVRLEEPFTLAGVTVVLSNLVSNVPAVLLLQPSVTAAGQTKLWYLLALVSTWAGNLTLVGSIANLIVAESAAAYGVEVNQLIQLRRLGSMRTEQ